MNLYGCIPVSYFPSHSALTYWAQAASLAGLPATDPTITSAGLALSLKKSQISQFNISDAVRKSRSAASLRTSSDDVPSSFRVTARAATPTGESRLTHHHAHMHPPGRTQHHRQQQQNHLHHLQHRPFSATPPPVGSGLAPLQALCDSDVSAFTGKTPSSAMLNDDKESLKFGMSRILSDDFGKIKTEKENNFQLSNVPESCRSLPLCPCNSSSCPAYARLPSPYHLGSLPSLSAVHALQPPNYPLSSSADALPGPYSILSTEGSSGNQPKRKRSWSRAVFSNLQRKGLEKRFEVQKYVTKPDRRQLAAMLGLTDAQVKVWFQNRRMKWRHAQQQGEKDKQIQQNEDKQAQKFQESGKPSNASAKRDASSSPEVNVMLIKHDADDSSVELRVRLAGTSPHHDAGICLISPPRDAISGQFVAAADRLSGEYSLHGIAGVERYRDLSFPPMLRGSRRSMSSGEDDPYSGASLEGRKECEDDSQSALEMDSDESSSEANSQTGKFAYRSQDEEDSGNFHDDASMKDIDVDN